MSIDVTNDLQPPSNSSSSSQMSECSDLPIGRYILTAISFTYALFTTPLSVSIICLGFQRWRQQRSVSTAAIMTHSDFFTYNMTTMELIGVFGSTLYYCSTYVYLPTMKLLGSLCRSFIWLGHIFFPVLTCAEHYLAVVHPIAYRGLGQACRIRIRNITTSCIWLICFAWVGYMILQNINIYYNIVPGTFMLTLSSTVMLFCSLSVLRVLIRPRPGKEGKDRVQVDLSKQRAIRTILIIMGVLGLKIGGSVVSAIITYSTLVMVKCIGEVYILIINLVSSLLLPVLFLERAGKL